MDLARPVGRRRPALAALLAAVIGVLVVGPLVVSAAGPVRAAVPEPDADTAVVQLYVGDVRTGGHDIGPLPDAIFGLFASPPDAAIDDFDGYVHVEDLPVGALLFQCRSDADGDCVFTVPIRPGATTACQNAPTNPRDAWPLTCQAGAGVTQGTRLWAAAITYGDPTADGFDYYANPWWLTAPLANTNHVAVRHVFQTQALVGGRSYLAGSQWITDPGLSTSPATPSVPPSGYTEFTRRIASGGVTPLSRYNVPLAPRCGMNIALVADVSSSIAASGVQGDLVDVMDAFVDSLRGTPSSVALFSFGTDSPANGFPVNTPLQSVATTVDAEAFKARYASWATMTPWPTNYTNWDRGLAAPAEANGAPGEANHFDLVLFITDGNPTVYGPSPLTAGGQVRDPNSGYTRFRELGNGLASANLLKSQGTKILAFGVGSGIDDPYAAYNLRTISGRDNYPAGTTDLFEADYVQTADWGVAAQAMRDLVLESCAPSVSVVKRVVPAGGTVADAILPAVPWGFEATTTTPGVTLDPATPPYAQTDLATGGVAFAVTFADPAEAPAVLRVEEDLTSQPGYTPLPDETVCVERSTGTDVPLTVTPDGTMAFSVEVGLEEMVTCVVYNQAPPEVEAASVVVHKIWEVHSLLGVESMPDGRQPTGLSTQLTLTGPASATATPQDWNAPRHGYDAASTLDQENSVTIDEAVTIAPYRQLCTVSSAGPEIKPGPPEDGGTYDPLPPGGLDSGVLNEGLNEWTIRNVVSCESRLTLVKDVTNGPLDSPVGEVLWELTAYGPGGYAPVPAQITGHSGEADVTEALVVPEAPYELAEAIPDPVPEHYMQHYVQEDLRSTPPQFPLSSGSWTCQADGTARSSPSLGTEGAVVVPLGMAYTCVVANTTSLITVDKTVDGEPAATPEDWRFLLTADEPILVPDPLDHEFPAGAEQSLVPGQLYELTEVETIPGYELEAMTCTSGGAAIPGFPDGFALLPGATAECTANNVAVAAGTFTVTKELDGTAATDPGLDDVEFEVAWSAATDPPQSGTLLLTPGATADPGTTFPEGTVVTLREVPGTLPDGIAWTDLAWSGRDLDVLDDGSVRLVVGGSGSVDVVLTNTVLAPGFVVRKEFTGEPDVLGAVEGTLFSVRWSADTDPSRSGTLELTGAGVTDPVHLPAGTVVTLSEVQSSALPDGVEWVGYRFAAGPGVVLSDDGRRAQVTVPPATATAPTVEVGLVNVFDGELPRTGAAVPPVPAALLALLACLLGTGGVVLRHRLLRAP